MAKKYPAPAEKQIKQARDLLLGQDIVRETGALFKKAGAEVYLVGGGVRDALLGNVHNDFDFATNAEPEKIISIMKKYADNLWTIGIDFGTVALEKDSVKLEITTFRREQYEPEDRHPQVNFAGSLETDLSRRDFTINAMALSLPEGEFFDPFGGLVDLLQRRLRTPLSPAAAFNDDPLRMLRALRFVSTLIVEPTPEVLAAVTEMRQRLKIVAAERVQAELSKLLLGLAPSQGVYYLVETGLAQEFLPELIELASCRDPEHRHKDLLEHTMTVVDRAPADLELRLAALLHDIGKPRTKSFDAGGVHFYHHEVLGAKMAERRLRSLKYPGALVANVKHMIAMHMRFHTYRLGWEDKAVRRYVRDCGPLLPKINQLVRADCTTRNPLQARKYAGLLDELDARITYLEEQEESAKIRPPLNGHEVMDYLNIPPGPRVGVVMKALLAARLDEKIMTKEEAYRFIDEMIKKDGLNVD